MVMVMVVVVVVVASSVVCRLSSSPFKSSQVKSSLVCLFVKQVKSSQVKLRACRTFLCGTNGLPGSWLAGLRSVRSFVRALRSLTLARNVG